MSIRTGCLAVLAAACVMAGCAGAGTGPVAEPSAVAPPSVIVGAGLPTQPAEPWLGPLAALASAVGAPVHAAGCAGSAALWGVSYVLLFPGEFSQDFKALIGDECAGPYLVTPAELASPGLPWPARFLRTPRTGTLPVEEAVQQALGPR